MKKLSFWLMAAGTGLVAGAASAVHESLWWLVAEAAGAFLIGTSWGHRS